MHHHPPPIQHSHPHAHAHTHTFSNSHSHSHSHPPPPPPQVHANAHANATAASTSNSNLHHSHHALQALHSAYATNSSFTNSLSTNVNAPALTNVPPSTLFSSVSMNLHAVSASSTSSAPSLLSTMQQQSQQQQQTHQQQVLHSLQHRQSSPLSFNLDHVSSSLHSASGPNSTNAATSTVSVAAASTVAGASASNSFHPSSHASLLSSLHHRTTSSPMGTHPQPSMLSTSFLSSAQAVPAPQHPVSSALPLPSSSAPLSAFHQVFLAQQQVSRQSSQPHQRARTAAALYRSHPPSNLLASQIDPNAPPRPVTKLGVPVSNSSHNLSFSSINGDVEDTEWSMLDMGGMHIRSLSPSLFQFSFLTVLYLNHNHLHQFPMCLTQLPNLLLLDLSANHLMDVPGAIGKMVQLHYLYLFDNFIEQVPWELGSLSALEQLGLEGNPIQGDFLLMLQKHGTHHFVAYLRDHAPPGSSPPERVWMTMEPPSMNGSVASMEETCSVFCYNILSEKYATQKQYGYTPSWALTWSYRGDAILQEILMYSADIVCLQEIELQQYQDFFCPQLKELGDYDSVFWMKSRARTMNEWERKSVDGCAIFYRSFKYRLLEQQSVEFSQLAMQQPDLKAEEVFTRVMTKDNIAVLALLQNKETQGELLVANCHIHWDPTHCDVKLVQVAMLMEHLERFLQARTDVPLFLCGDFNSTPASGVYELLATGTVEKSHRDFLAFNYGHYTEPGARHSLELKSAYDHHLPLRFTNFVPKFADVIDYIWFSHTCLDVIGLLGGVDPEYCSKCVGFPNAHFPSDHIPLLAEFSVHRQKTKANQTSTVLSSVSSSSTSLIDS